MGHQQSPSILKIGSIRAISRERWNFETIEDVLGNNAPQIRGYIEIAQKGGIRFAYASMAGIPRTFQAIYSDLSLDQQIIHSMLDDTFRLLQRFYNAATFEQYNLFNAYNFDEKGWNWRSGGSDTPSAVKERIKALFPGTIKTGNEPTIVLPNGRSLRNVALFLEKKLPLIKASTMSRDFHFVSIIHGGMFY